MCMWWKYTCVECKSKTQVCMIATRIHMQGIIAHLSWVYDLWKVSEKTKQQTRYVCWEEKVIKDLLYEELKKREQQLKTLKQKLETSIQNAPSGNLKIIKCKEVEQYYMDSPETRLSYPNGKYLRKSDSELARKLAQRSYDEKLLSETEKQLKNLQYIIKKCEKQEIAKVEELGKFYDKMGLSRKKLVNPRIVSDEEYAVQWLAKSYSGKDFAEGQTEIYTEKGERVRSKSEKIIADMLYYKKIPYRYECPVTIKELGTIYPDFTCLRLSDRKPILWELLEG